MGVPRARRRSHDRHLYLCASGRRRAVRSAVAANQHSGPADLSVSGHLRRHRHAVERRQRLAELVPHRHPTDHLGRDRHERRQRFDHQDRCGQLARRRVDRQLHDQAQQRGTERRRQRGRDRPSATRSRLRLEHAERRDGNRDGPQWRGDTHLAGRDSRERCQCLGEDQRAGRCRRRRTCQHGDGIAICDHA